MDLQISADEATISSTRSNSQVNVFLSGINERDLLEKEVFQSIGIADFVGEFGADNVLQMLKENYPELFND